MTRHATAGGLFDFTLDVGFECGVGQERRRGRTGARWVLDSLTAMGEAAVKAAEAEELAAKHKAVEITTLAQARMDAAAKEADAKKKLAEGTQAEQAAPGLAAAKVQEATADAAEKEGLAQARVITAKGEADANVIRNTGEAEAKVVAARGESEAMAKRQVGMAEAEVVREKYKAEAEGLVDKFTAMGNMSDQARQHEEFRMSLEIAFKEAIAAIEAGKEIAKENAEVLATALAKAKIDIVGGEEHFFDNFAKSLSIGKAVDGLATKSSTIANILESVLAMTGRNSTNSSASIPGTDLTAN